MKIVPAGLTLAAALALCACAQHPAHETKVGIAAGNQPPPSEQQPPASPAAESPADSAAEGSAEAQAELAAPAGSAPPITTGKPYAFVCVPYDDRPRPPPRKAEHKDLPAAPPVPAAAPAASEPSSESKGAVISILGKKVFDRDGKDLGRVVDVLADHGGRARAAVIDFGGFLGVGNRRVAVDWRALQFDPADSSMPVILTLGPDQIQTAPEFRDAGQTPPIIVGGPSGNTPPRPQ